MGAGRGGDAKLPLNGKCLPSVTVLLLGPMLLLGRCSPCTKIRSRSSSLLKASSRAGSLSRGPNRSCSRGSVPLALLLGLLIWHIAAHNARCCSQTKWLGRFSAFSMAACHPCSASSALTPFRCSERDLRAAFPPHRLRTQPQLVPSCRTSSPTAHRARGHPWCRQHFFGAVGVHLLALGSSLSYLGPASRHKPCWARMH